MSLLDFAKSEEQSQGFIYTEEQLMVRLKFFIGICLSLTLTGIVFVVLYSIIFVTQPLNAISPIDQKFFELIIPIATFLTGTLSGIMLAGNDKDAQKAALEAANKGWERVPQTSTTSMNIGGVTASMTTTAPPPPSAPMFAPQAPAFTPSIVSGYGGKPAPAQPPFPIL
jgi:hypothetical protein